MPWTVWTQIDLFYMLTATCQKRIEHSRTQLDLLGRVCSQTKVLKARLAFIFMNNKVDGL